MKQSNIAKNADLFPSFVYLNYEGKAPSLVNYVKSFFRHTLDFTKLSLEEYAWDAR